MTQAKGGEVAMRYLFEDVVQSNIFFLETWS